MGRTEGARIPFTEEEVKNRDLVIRMLRYEDSLGKGGIGREIYTSEHYLPLRSLTPEKTLNRLVLDHFGFSSDDSSVENYRTIFSYYYRSPTDYDEEVLSSVYYMRHNRLMYYTTPAPQVGERYTDVPLYDLEGEETRLSHLLEGGNRYTFVAAFSTS